MQNKIKLSIIGTRGVPARYGGFETFAQEISLRFIENGYQVLVVGDSSNHDNSNRDNFISIINSRFSKPDNPLLFYFDSFRISKNWGANIIISCGVGGSVFSRFFQSKNTVVINNPDGLGFMRNKYSSFKRFLFKLLYIISVKTEKYIICDSVGIRDYYLNNFRRNNNIFIAEYGTHINPFYKTKKTVDFNFDAFKRNNYYLVVSRLEPENNVELIIKAYLLSNQLFPLVVVGNINTPHSKYLQKYSSKNVLFIGGVYEKSELNKLRAFTIAYFHGHSVGGTNPSLLEAMGSANICVCHNNIFNKSVVGENGFYFKSTLDLKKIFLDIEKNPYSNYLDKIRINTLERAKLFFSWDVITKKYLNIIHKIIN